MEKNSNHWQAMLPEIILLLAIAVLLGLNLGAFEIDPYSELFHIGAAKQMVGAGRFWIPVLNGHDYLIRAPFWTWIVTAFFKVLGPSLWVARIPAIICALAGLVLTYMLSLDLTKNRMASLFAAAMLGTSWGYFHLGSLSTADILATCLYLGFFLTVVKFQSAVSRRNPNPLAINAISLAFGIIIGVLFLAKGTTSVLFMLGIGLAYLMFNQDLALLGRLNFRSAVLTAVCIPLPWLLYISIARGNALFIPEYTFVQPFQRLIGEGPWQALHMDPLFYLKRLASDFIPYVLILPAAVWECYLSRRNALSSQLRSAPWLATWFGVGLIGYSLSVFQEPTLMLPFYPAVAILIGYYLGRAIEVLTGNDAYNNTLAGYILGTMFVAVLSTIIIFQVLPSDYVVGFWHLPGKPVIEALDLGKHHIDLPEAFPLWKFWLIPGPFILLVGGITIFVLHALRRVAATAMAMIVTCMLFLLFVKMVYLPIMQRPVPEMFARQLNHQVTKSDSIVLYSLHPDVKRVMFYLDNDKMAHTRFARTPQDFQKALSSGQGTVYGVIREKSFFNELDYTYRNFLRINRFDWKWDMTRLSELRKLLVVRQPRFEKMRSEMLYFQSVPSSSLHDIQVEISTNPGAFDSLNFESDPSIQSNVKR